VCDVFLQELNRADSLDLSHELLAQLLSPFLHAAANCRNKTLINKIVERIFLPLLENNTTI
jgi:hypothetical protein